MIQWHLVGQLISDLGDKITDIITHETNLTINANSIAWFNLAKPSDNKYKWVLASVCSNTSNVAVHDFSNGGARFWNHTNNSVTLSNVDVLWIGYRNK